MMAESDELIITNKQKQSIPINVSPPNGDFFAEQKQYWLHKNKSVTLPKRYLNMSQINNLKAKGVLSVSPA
jgi:hypothetical protein